MSAPIVLVAYDPEWPAQYEHERVQISDVAGESVLAIEHIGSTAVPGLAAKPIIDIMLAIRSLSDAPGVIARLECLGYSYVPEYELSIPERRYLRKGPPNAVSHHIHMVEISSDFWDRHLLFRDYLREHPATRQAYETLKHDLAAQFGSDRSAYSDAKTGFVSSVERLARAEYRNTQPDKFWAALDYLLATSKLVIDRTRGSEHPRYPGFVYPFDYGYVEGTAAMDGAGIDVWVGSAERKNVTAVIVSVDLGKRDAEIKILLGCTAEEAQAILRVHNSNGQAGVLVERPA